MLARSPDHAAALALLGFIELSQDRFGEALVVFDRLCRLEPGERAHWFNLGNALRGAGQADDALKALGKAAELGESSADFLYILGLTHMARGDFEAGRAVLADALALAPGDPEVRRRYVFCCYECMRFELALAALEDWLPLPGTAAETVAAIAQVLLNLGEYARAELILGALDLGRLNANTLLIQVQILERTNRLAEADALLGELLALPDAQALGADLVRVGGKIAQRRGDPALALELYRRAMADYGEPHDRHFVLFPIAEALHALGRHDETMETLIDAHRSQVAFIRRSRPLAGLRGIPQMAVAEYPCDPADVAAWDHSGAPPAAQSPVFVVAFPRSGTTLLELTLDAHPLLVSMDEQPFVQNALEDIRALDIGYPDELRRLTPTQLDQIRAGYYARVARKVTLAPGQRLVDKNPLNILRIPVIARLFPESPILLAVRHPCDVLLSCYMQHFRAPDFAMLCADIRSLTVGYRKTFDFWYENIAILQSRVLEVRYEQFVADFPAEVRRIAEFLGLPWDAAMLQPGDRALAKGFISTPSYSQVTRPVNTRAVGRWQAYRPYLEPALPVLEPYFTRWGYGT